MKKRVLIVIIILILVVIIVLGGMYLIDRNRMKNNEPVLFSTWGYKYNPPMNEDENIEEEIIITETLATSTASNGTISNSNSTVSSYSNEILVTYNAVEPDTTIVTMPGSFSDVSNSTPPYNPSNSVIETPDGLATLPSPADPNVTVTNPAEPVEINRTVDKVSMEVLENTVTKTGATIVIKDKNETPYAYGTWFRIDKKVVGGWKKMETIRDDVSFTSIALLPNDDGVLQNKEDWTKIYGELEPGEYRIVKEIYENGSKYIYAEFSIEE